MNSKIEKLSNEQMEKVSGGIKTINMNDNSYWNPGEDVYCKKREEWKDNTAKKEEIREMIKIFDSQMGHNLAIGECPGCGCLVNSIGNVCTECRKQACN